MCPRCGKPQSDGMLCAACDGGKAQPDAAAAKPKAAEAKTPAADANVAEPAASDPAVSEPAPADADPLGQRFRDPPWFRGTMLGDKGTKSGKIVVEI